MAGRVRTLMMPTLLTGALALAVQGGAAPAQAPGSRNMAIAETDVIHVGSGTLEVDFAEGPLDLPKDAILAHIRKAAAAIVAYYGRFPLSRARVLVVPVANRGGAPQGTTWGDVGGFQGFTRLRVGEHTTQADLDDDWVTTHELVHMTFPSQEREHHWIEEGLATYVEPLARVKTGELRAEKVWGDMVRDMHQGEPGPGDEGLDHTHTWGRTYWGGALFCLVADVEIRRETDNRKGLEDALRGIADAGGTIDQDWTIEKTFAEGDRATGTHVLTDLYAKWKDAPITVDLDKMWSDLGVRRTDRGIEFDAAAPEARIREAIAADATKPLGNSKNR